MLHARVKWFGSFNKNDTWNAFGFGRSTSCFYTAQKVLLQRMGHQPPWQKQKLGVFRFRWKLGWMSLRITRSHICCVHPPPWFTVDKQIIHFYEGANTNLHELYWHTGWGVYPTYLYTGCYCLKHFLRLPDLWRGMAGVYKHPTYQKSQKVR